MMIKGKRTKRARPSDTTTSSSTTITPTDEDDQDMAAYCLILLAQGGTKPPKPTTHHHDSPKTTVTTIVTASASTITAYECKTCNRCFPSFQALGGHRASHNKPKLLPPEKPPSFTFDDHHHHQDYSISNKEEMMGLSLQMACNGYNSSNTLSASNTNNKPKIHACSICGAEFSSGQALGGHMRRHRPLPSASAGSPPEQAAAAPRSQLCLDLNLPADEQEEVAQSAPGFTFASNDNTLVFSASLVDCRY